MENETKKQVYYCNVANIEGSTFDIVMNLGMKKDRKKNITHDDIDVTIIMSPQHAKAFSKALADNIANYEKAFGEIIIEPNLVE